jgi:PAS domain S-box-containing protein
MSTISIPAAGSRGPVAKWFEDGRQAHAVQFYTEDSSLLESLCRFVGGALGAGDAAVVVATQAHRDGLETRLSAHGFDIAKARQEGRYVPLDAAATLSDLSVSGELDAARFAELMGGTIERARTSTPDGRRNVVAFGEMVALLWVQSRPDEAMRLERFWNELAREHSFSLRCAYPMTAFNRREHAGFFQHICSEHSSVIPGESYTTLMTEQERLRDIARLQQKAEALEQEVALRQSEERFRLLVESVQDYAIFMLNPEGCVTTWNIGVERIKGYKASEILGKHFSCFYPERDLRAGKPQRALRLAAEQGRFEDEGWRVRKDGSQFWANVVVTALRDEGGRLTGYAKVTRDITEKMRAQESLRQSAEELRNEISERMSAARKLRASEEALRRLSRDLLRTQDEERRRLGRELHDTVGQYIAALKMGLDCLQTAAGEQLNGASHHLAECSRLADEAVKEVRTISYLLYPPLLEEMGLRSAVPWFVEGFAKRSGISTHTEMAPELDRLPREVELTLFRVLQEALTNVHRHSGSATADVRIWLAHGEAHLEIRDQGKGIPVERLDPVSPPTLPIGVGLRSMTERVHQLGGRLDVFSSDHGTTISAAVPFESA